MTPEELKSITHELNTQDNRTTKEPLFCVFEKYRIYGVDPGYHAAEIGIDENGYKVPYIEADEFVNAHFTRRAADQYISENRHNLNDPYVYVMSLHRCDEMIKIRHFLMDGTNIEG